MHRFCNGWMRVLGLLLLVVGGQVACKPTYPKCEQDTDCPGNKDGKEFCVNGQCQQCRPGNVKDCPVGQRCAEGRCVAEEGACKSNADCPGGVCENGRCTACKEDAQCPGGRCNKGKCETETRARCKSNDDCKESEDCVNGFCTPASGRRFTAGDSGGGCELSRVYFGFNEYVLSAETTNLIDRNGECIKQKKRAVALVGHTDPRGTTEYNLALSEKRAQAVRERLVRMGVSGDGLSTVPRGELDATGTEESGWKQDRSVEFQWR